VLSLIGMSFLSKLLKKHPLAIVIVGIAYIISPFDFISEFPVGPLGLIDDAAILGFVINALREMQGRKKDASSQDLNESHPKEDANVIDVESEKAE